MTFREFAGALMQGKRDEATAMLEPLLGLTGDAAAKASDYFGERIKDPAFMMKAMGLRNAVQSGSDDDIGNVLVDCFGLDDTQRAGAVAAVRKRYPPPAPPAAS
ncbi:MAG TPA: hypothetical protein VIV11_18915 [Kofleriaceae bacterium]